MKRIVNSFAMVVRPTKKHGVPLGTMSFILTPEPTTFFLFCPLPFTLPGGLQKAIERLVYASLISYFNLSELGFLSPPGRASKWSTCSSRRRHDDAGKNSGLTFCTKERKRERKRERKKFMNKPPTKHTIGPTGTIVTISKRLCTRHAPSWRFAN